METKTNFEVVNGTGFHITFENGITLSVQWGSCTRTSNQTTNYVAELQEIGKGIYPKCKNCEVALVGIIPKELQKELFGTDQTKGFLSPDELVEIMEKCKDYKLN